ncbi:MAG: glycosyl hydrolase 53 family protein [Lewinella sp.]|nr:glycosyl hydrolase 53 family protein [Lewinella sp.]
MKSILTWGIALGMLVSIRAQDFYFGADLSYVNEMEDCGVVYRENEQPKDPYAIFADHGCNLVRLRLWHTPSWYDDLNSGQRYSDFADVRRSIVRAKAAGMDVLLDFHLSDLWADPSRQIAPAAWQSVLDDWNVLGDSVYHYVYQTLTALSADDLLPEMVQIGNETNRGILLSPEVNDAGWTLDWDRNTLLFNRAISAVRDVESAVGQPIKVALHLAGPANATWFVDNFVANGVTDFDVIGMSYYWAWHMPTTIAETGDVIAAFRQNYPDKEVIIFETGYIWTTDHNDDAANIISAVHPDYAPASPQAQRAWLEDLTQEVINSGGSGVIYWEPAWVSSDCWTLWGHGSHQEHATFFDFSNNLIEEGGIAWMSADYDFTVSTTEIAAGPQFAFRVWVDSTHTRLHIALPEDQRQADYTATLIHLDGARLQETALAAGQAEYQLALPELSSGLYFLVLSNQGRVVGKEKVVIVK